ncbi:hypothetical protein FXN61_28750 [Lentzea sp. PSKA42]|uniref:Uncharacterized protein n=1 Tax=Lentzea indica TaxID=2604800 RepID=A0ABX1FNH7_9PSEU|nr:hypothetical protein [Lentzea indica]NKE60561.1 hypothetical protein [Lentzea indica]
MLALVRPLDELYLARSISSPDNVDLRGLLAATPPRTRLRPPDTFTFTAELVHVGWLLVVVGDSRGQRRLHASFLTPALDDLLEALVTLTTGGRHVRVSWDAEPTEFRWLISVDTQAHVRLLVLPDRSANSPDDLGNLVLSADLPLRSLVRTVAVAAQALLTRLGEAGYARQWDAGPFPADRLRTLQRWLGQE